MRRTSGLLLPIAVIALLLAVVGVAWRDSRANEEATTRPEPAMEAASLVELRAVPAGWLGRHARLTLQLRGTVETWNPYHTRFGPPDWIGFEGWADERLLWVPEIWDDPVPRLFTRRGGAAARELDRARALDRFEAVVVVREVFLGEPWIEVLSLEPLDERVPEGTVLHVCRARLLQDRGQWELALQQYERGKSGPLPDHVRAEIDRLIAECEAARDAATGTSRTSR